MSARMILSLFAMTISASMVSAAEPPKKREPTAQQQRMKSCNGEAKAQALKGEPRKLFMRDCLKGKPSR